MFLHPGQDKYCSVSLETPCADLDLFALRHDVYTFGCPTTQTLGVSCEASVTNGPARDESIDYLYENNEQWYMIVVDAKNPQEDWFRLSVSCE